MTTGRTPHTMTDLEYRVLKSKWRNDNRILFVDIAERCYAEGWLDREGVLTQKGKIAIGLYETFRVLWPEDDEEDLIPWEGDSVLYLDSYRMSEAAAVPSYNNLIKNAAASAGAAANDKQELPKAAADPCYLAAPESQELYG